MGSAGAWSTVPLGCGVGSASVTVGVGAGCVVAALSEGLGFGAVEEDEALAELLDSWPSCPEVFPEEHALAPRVNAMSVAPVSAVRMRRVVRSYMCLE